MAKTPLTVLCLFAFRMRFTRAAGADAGGHRYLSGSEPGRKARPSCARRPQRAPAAPGRNPANCQAHRGTLGFCVVQIAKGWRRYLCKARKYSLEPPNLTQIGLTYFFCVC